MDDDASSGADAGAANRRPVRLWGWLAAMRSRAAILLARDEPLVIDEIDLPDPGPDQVVLELIASGICHTQLHQMPHRPVPEPTLLGHEGSGVVVKVGRDVQHLKEGDHAMVTWLHRSRGSGPRDGPPTGASYRGRQFGDKNSVFTWSDYTLTAGDHAIRMRPDDPADISCVVGCALATGAGAVLNTAQVTPGASVAVFGAGGAWGSLRSAPQPFSKRAPSSPSI